MRMPPGYENRALIGLTATPGRTTEDSYDNMGGNEECILIDINDNLQAFDNETAFSHFNDYWRI